MTLNGYIPNVISLECAVQSIMQLGYSSFLLTVGYNTVSIYLNSNGVFSLFDSHARDASGMPHPQGTWYFTRDKFNKLFGRVLKECICFRYFV